MSWNVLVPSPGRQWMHFRSAGARQSGADGPAVGWQSAQKFADISQEYPALRLDSLDTRVVHSIQNSKNQTKSYISQKLVASKIEKVKNTKGGVEGDLPVKLSKQFSQELAVPAAKIFNKIVELVSGHPGGR